MGGSVGGRDLQAARAHDNLTVAHDDSAERLLAHGRSKLRLLNGNCHESLVISAHVGSAPSTFGATRLTHAIDLAARDAAFLARQLRPLT